MLARREAERDGGCWPEGVKWTLSNTRKGSSVVEQEIPVVKQRWERSSRQVPILTNSSKQVKQQSFTGHGRLIASPQWLEYIKGH